MQHGVVGRTVAHRAAEQPDPAGDGQPAEPGEHREGHEPGQARGADRPAGHVVAREEAGQREERRPRTAPPACGWSRATAEPRSSASPGTTSPARTDTGGAATRMSSMRSPTTVRTRNVTNHGVTTGTGRPRGAASRTRRPRRAGALHGDRRRGLSAPDDDVRPDERDGPGEVQRVPDGDRRALSSASEPAASSRGARKATRRRTATARSSATRVPTTPRTMSWPCTSASRSSRTGAGTPSSRSAPSSPASMASPAGASRTSRSGGRPVPRRFSTAPTLVIHGSVVPGRTSRPRRRRAPPILSRMPVRRTPAARTLASGSRVDLLHLLQDGASTRSASSPWRRDCTRTRRASTCSGSSPTGSRSAPERRTVRGRPRMVYRAVSADDLRTDPRAQSRIEESIARVALTRVLLEGYGRDASAGVGGVRRSCHGGRPGPPAQTPRRPPRGPTVSWTRSRATWNGSASTRSSTGRPWRSTCTAARSSSWPRRGPRSSATCTSASRRACSMPSPDRSRRASSCRSSGRSTASCSSVATTRTALDDPL